MRLERYRTSRKYFNSNECLKVLYVAQLHRSHPFITTIGLDLYSLRLENLTRTFSFRGTKEDKAGRVVLYGYLLA